MAGDGALAPVHAVVATLRMTCRQKVLGLNEPSWWQACRSSDIEDDVQEEMEGGQMVDQPGKQCGDIEAP